ncbi:transglutaminase domain-containing protein [Psychroserpens sp. SPM9]|uniref:transglutaminase domain-containing protein n=1 Tax=Psychroserpens sp. SPM9 TaxID=2975598 RepID=UPI0021A3BB67|nr:transglutaminase domain-containing protein [Psychroserpens sp. SPM9]MDG5490277.1 transglutaminase domain-containing protein [Psychroserpens sp. SPM9]
MKYLWLFIFVFQSHAQRSDFDHINFQKADSIALTCKDEGLYNLPQLAFKLTSNLTTDVERFRAIYKWVCTNIANDYNLYLRNKRKRTKFKNDSLKLTEWNTRFKKEIFRKLLKQEKTICTGYAYIVQELSKLANIDCEIVHGFGKTSTTHIEKSDPPNHSWNAVKLNNKWYLCDPTWASGIPNPETNAFKFKYNDGYFLANPKLFAVNHFPLERQWALIESAPTFDEFLAAPILYGNAYANLTGHNAPKEMYHLIHKYETLQFEYELQSVVNTETIRFLIDNGHHSQKVKPTSIHLENQSLILEQQFDVKGFYDVHLYIGDDLISTYTVKVKS